MSLRVFFRCAPSVFVPGSYHVLRLKTRFNSTVVNADNVDETKSLQWKMKSFYTEFPGSEDFLNAFKPFQLDVKTLVDMIWKEPEIANYKPAVVTSNIEELLQLGFNIENVCSMITKYPYLLNYEPQQIVNTFEMWRSCQLSERFLRKLFIQEPWLFSVSDEQVKRRVPRIHYLMCHKINRVTSLLLLNPSLLIHDWDRVEENFLYVTKRMRILEKEISRSTALTLPLSHVRMRHCFLEKCGVYVRPTLKDDVGFSPHKNPSLSDMVDTPDDVFAVNTAMVSVEEYQVYKKLYTYEDEDADSPSKKKSWD